MKTLKQLLFLLPLFFFSCSSDSDSDSQNNTPTPTYAMTAKINNVDFAANNPFGTNLYSSTNLWNYFPISDFVMLQGRQGGVFGTPEINIWLKRTQIAVGTYNFGLETFSTPPSHYINLFDSTTSDSEYTKQGSITITSVNTTTKVVIGTFQFTTVPNVNDPAAVVNKTITNGTFNYKYEN